MNEQTDTPQQDAAPMPEMGDGAVGQAVEADVPADPGLQPRTELQHCRVRLLTTEAVQEKIAETSYFTHGRSMLCALETKTGFKVFGHYNVSASEICDVAQAKSRAYDDAWTQLCRLEEYLLWETLHRREVADQQFDSAGMGAATSVSDQPVPAA